MIEELKPTTAQLSNWQFCEIIVQKINEIIVAINALLETKTDDTGVDFTKKEISDKEETDQEEKEKIENV